MEKISCMPDKFIYNSNHLYQCKIGNLIVGVDIPRVIVINLESRTDRKERVINELTKYNIPFSFYFAELAPDPVRGCLESHINIIKWALQEKYKQVCIFEDDIVIQHSLYNIPTIPDNFDMIYLGGLCTEITDTIKLDNNVSWIKGRAYCNHAYIVRDTVYEKIITEGWKCDHELDRFYTENIHPYYNAYLLFTQFVIQHDGWSDIDRKTKWTGYNWPKPGDRFNIP